jgi:hypothetical protein
MWGKMRAHTLCHDHGAGPDEVERAVCLMMSSEGGRLSPNEAVVAGSPEFVDAMLPMFTERLGGAPRVADSPHLASALCQDGARLLVYEYGGREWLALCAELRGITGPDLLVVVALPPEHAADIAQISASSSAVVAWRGQVQPVLDAANRVMAARDAPPPPPRRTGPVLTPQPARAAVRPSPTPPAASAPPPRPVMTPSPRPAVTPVPPAAAPSLQASRSPAAAPAGADPFDAIFDEAASADAPAPATAAASPPPAASPTPSPMTAPPPLAVWPATVLSAVDGQAVVRAALSGLWPEPRLRATTEKVVGSLSTAEKAATLGQKLPFDPVPVRRAVGLRWQVAAALDTLPAQGAQVDQAAIQAILGGIDEVLGLLKTESDDASPEALRSVEMVRHGLVKEAIDLTEALQQVLPADVVEEITTSRKAKRPEPAPVTRMVHPAPAQESERSGLPWGLIIVLVLSIAGAAAFHGYRYVNRPRPGQAAVTGAPTGTVGTIAPQGKIVVAPAGAKLDPKEIENFKNLERAKGNEVREVMPGTFVVTPPAARPEKAADGGDAQKQGERQ